MARYGCTHPPLNTALGRQGLEGLCALESSLHIEFYNSQGNIVKPCLKITTETDTHSKRIARRHLGPNSVIDTPHREFMMHHPSCPHHCKSQKCRLQFNCENGSSVSHLNIKENSGR